MTDIAAIATLIEPDAAALGFDLVRVRWFGGDANGDGPTLQVMAERPATGQLTIDDCASLSRLISERFDALEAAGNDPVAEAYRLEVSSPGIDRPLTRLKDFAAWAGHEARVTVAGGVVVAGGRKTLSGPIIAVVDDTIRLEDKKVGLVSITLTDIDHAKLLLTDKLIAATRPLDTSGADDLVEYAADAGEEED